MPLKRFGDWSLRSKLLVTSFLLVIVVTLMVLAAVVLNLRKLRQHAIPDQRVILNLKSLTFDYLSEVREYVVAPEAATLEELSTIEIQLAARLNEHRTLAHDDDSRVAVIEVELRRLTDLGQGIVRAVDRIRDSLEAAEAAEKELLELGGTAGMDLSLVTRGYAFLSEVREFVLDPGDETAAELAQLSADLTLANQTWGAENHGQIVRLLETGRTAVRLRQELTELLEAIEDAERDLSGELDAAVAVAREEVAVAARALFASVLWTGLAGLVLASLLALTVARWVSRPLEQLQAASRLLAAGELDARSPVEAADEVGRLSEDFNRLATEFERLISELRRAKAFNESIVASVPSGLVTLDGEARVTSANPVFREHWRVDEPTGRRLARWIDTPDLERAVETVLAGGDDVHGLDVSLRPGQDLAERAVFRTSVVGLRPTNPGDRGEKRPSAADTASEPRSTAQALVIFEDITESRRLLGQLEQKLTDLGNTQTQLVQSGKMAAVGELAAGVAHELNNPLSVVLTYSVLLQEKLARASEEAQDQLPGFSERLDLMKASSERCKTIVDNLLQFSRQDDTEISRVDVADLLAQTFDLIGSQLRRHQVAVNLEVEEGLPPVRGNINQLQQVLTNLAINAQQAMSDRGKLDIDVRRQGSECELTVTDNGQGIAGELLARIFEPFFTTKPVGQGTGLGLAITYGIVQSHGGEITVDSVVGAGTTFRIRLPFAEGRGHET